MSYCNAILLVDAFEGDVVQFKMADNEAIQAMTSVCKEILVQVGTLRNIIGNNRVSLDLRVNCGIGSLTMLVTHNIFAVRMNRPFMQSYVKSASRGQPRQLTLASTFH